MAALPHVWRRPVEWPPTAAVRMEAVRFQSVRHDVSAFVALRLPLQPAAAVVADVDVVVAY